MTTTRRRVIRGATIGALLAVTAALIAPGLKAAPVDVNDNLGQQALQNLSSFEKRVLKDKHVTDAERATTLRVFTQCLTNAGIEYEIDPDQTGIASVWMYGGTAAQAGRTTQDDAAAMDHCIDQVNAIENVWILQHPDNAAGAAPLPGLAQALATLDTSQW